MTAEDVKLCWEALEKVPRLPSYAIRALQRLKHEMTTALAQEAVKDVDPWDNAPSL
jgi:hypothetical protein